jgi:hypothetical protein
MSCPTMLASSHRGMIRTSCAAISEIAICDVQQVRVSRVDRDYVSDEPHRLSFAGKAEERIRAPRRLETPASETFDLISARSRSPSQGRSSPRLPFRAKTSESHRRPERSMSVACVEPRRAKTRVMPLQKARQKCVGGFKRAAALVMAPYSASFGAMLLSIALWDQNGWGWSALQTGLAIAPGPLLVPITSLLFSGRLIQRFGAARVVAAGILFFACGLIGWRA